MFLHGQKRVYSIFGKERTILYSFDGLLTIWYVLFGVANAANISELISGKYGFRLDIDW